MTPRKLLVALFALAALSPTVQADDRDWGYPPDYDVSVELGPSDDLDFESFHGPLSSYGEWVVAGNYGRVWRPRVVAGWRPYYYGHWEWTHEGWLWVSDEAWGWATYHYGRWAHDPHYGWIWVPGYEWAPAWVSWRVSGDVVGWAPLAPGLSVYVSSYPFVDFWWTFVPTVRLVSVPVYTVAYAPSYTRRWYHETAPAPARPAPRAAPGRPAPAPAPAWGGPAPRLIAERTGRPLAAARIVAAPAPGVRGRPGEVPVYRPCARRGAERSGGAAFAPSPGGGRRDAFVAPPAPGDERGRGRGPAFAAPPRSGDERGRGRGSVNVPAPGRGAERREDVVAPPPARGGGEGHERGREGAVAAPPSRGEDRGRGPSAAPAWSGRSGEPRGGGSSAPAWRSGESRGGGSSGPPASRGGGRGERPSSRGER